MPITASSRPSNSNIVEASDPIINSISVLKQLLQQQKQNQSNTQKDKGSVTSVGEIDSPSRSQDETVGNQGTSIYTPRTKLVDAERIIANERALRTTLEKAFDDLSQHRKLLQEQLNQLQLRLENQTSGIVEDSAQAATTTLTSSEADENAETNRENVVNEATALFQEQQLSWEKERDQLNKTIQFLKEEASKDKNDAESKLLEQKESYSSEINSLQRQLESLQEELSSLQGKYQINVQEKSGESVKETTLLEFENLKRDHDAILMMLKNVSSDGAKIQRENDNIAASNSIEDTLKVSSESQIVGKVRDLISQLNGYQNRISTLEISLADTKKETENLEHALAKAENHTPDSTAGFDEATHATNDDQSDTETHSIERGEHRNLKDEVRKLRGALKDAIGEASRSQRILNSLETRLHDKKLLTSYCQKLHNEKDDLRKISQARIVIEGETECISTVQLSETITEDREKTGAPSDINIQLYETRELLEQNKKLVTLLQSRIQKFETDTRDKDSQIESLKQELQLMKQDNNGPVEKIRKDEIEYSMSRDEDQDDDDEEEEDQDDEVEEKESEEGENSDQEVEVIDLNDDSDEDLSNQQNEDDEINATSGNVVEESDVDDETEEPHSKKQRLENDKDGNDSASADI